MNNFKILRFPQVSTMTGRTRPSLNYLIKAGLFPRPVKLSMRAAGFPDYEVEKIMKAQIGGATVDQIRSLVCKIHAQRREVSV